MTYLDKLLQRWRVRKAAQFIPPGARVLDIGTADGALFRALADVRDSVGVDLDLDHNKLPKSPGVTFYQGTFPQVLPNPRTFDVITMLATLEHIPESALDGLAADCAAHLRPGGKLILTVPSPRVDTILPVLQKLGVIDGMAAEQHHGFDVQRTPFIFQAHSFRLRSHQRFQLGLNHLFVFELE
ncbi:MAG TPA: class I SAM-dependent methyltransferase [Acidobacteriaceae bacterium]|nr:class I SAM-dependent methyltransferase [Acidobacteriaceae bacterium]